MSKRSYQPQQTMIYFCNPEDILGEDHFCFVVDEIVEHLDLKGLPNKEGTVGAPHYDYRVLIKVLFYGYATGVFSSREIMKCVQENIAYLYLTRQQVPNFRTISDFRKNYRLFLENSFIKIVQAAKEIGLVKLGTISLDSTKIRANASNQKTFTQAELKEQKKRIEEAIRKSIDKDNEEDDFYGAEKTGKELPKALRKRESRLERIQLALQKAEELGKEKINITDHDAHYMKDSKVIQTNYNCQIAVDNDSEIIVSNETTTTPADSGAVKTQIEKIKETLGVNPQEVLADSGYYSVENITYLDKKNIAPYIPHQDDARSLKDKFKGKENDYDKNNFKYDSKKNRYVCPEGQVLTKKTVQRKKGLTLYQCKSCHQCDKKHLCVRGNAAYRIVSRYEDEDILLRIRNRFKSKKGKNKYSKRAPSVETPFAHFKKNLKFLQFFCRGAPRVGGEFTLLCIGYNIKKIAKLVGNTKYKTQFNLALS